MDLHGVEALGKLARAPRWSDGPAAYGWVSIGLHWLSAAAILALLFVGGSMETGDRSGPSPTLHLHTSLALSVYVLLAARVAWRAAKGHPQRLPRQGRISYALGRWFHWALMLALAAMLVSGPLAAWSGGLPIDLWAWRAPAATPPSPRLFALAQQVHYVAANCLGWGAVVHVLAVAKHVAVDRDGALERMLFPTGAGEQEPR